MVKIKQNLSGISIVKLLVSIRARNRSRSLFQVILNSLEKYSSLQILVFITVLYSSSSN